MVLNLCFKVSVGNHFDKADHQQKWFKTHSSNIFCFVHQVRTNLVKRCGDSNHGNRLITNGGQMWKYQESTFIFQMIPTSATISCHISLPKISRSYCHICCCHILLPGVYFIFRMLATMALASCFILLDAQTIQMCTSEKVKQSWKVFQKYFLKILLHFQNWIEQKNFASWGEARPHWQLWKADPLQNSCSGLRYDEKWKCPIKHRSPSLTMM